MIRQAIEQKLRDRPEYSGSHKLWASDLGQCPRKAIMRLRGYEGESFGIQSLEAMNFGILYEADTLAALKHCYPGYQVRDQLRLENEVWSGKADAVLALPEQTIIVEHKAVGDKWWNYNGKLPDPGHVAQLCLYGLLYEEKYGTKPALILYYRAWGNWAELTVEIEAEQVKVTGLMNGNPFERILPMNIKGMRQELEGWFAKKEEVLPPKLVNKDEGCLFRGQPGCPYYRHCWGE